MSFKNLYIVESLKMGRYEKYIQTILLSLRKSLLEQMPFLKTKSKSEVMFDLKLIFRQFEIAKANSDKSLTNKVAELEAKNKNLIKVELAKLVNEIPGHEFSRYSHKFITISIPTYLNNETIDVNFYYILSNKDNFEARTRNKDVLIRFGIDTLIKFLENNKEVVDDIEDSIVHELTHIVDPGYKQNSKTVNKILKTNTKDNAFEYYVSLPWEKVAFHTQNVRRVIQNILKDKEFHKIAEEGNVQKVSKYLLDKIKNLKEYLDMKLEIKDRNKIYKELYKEVMVIVEKYKKSVEET